MRVLIGSNQKNVKAVDWWCNCIGRGTYDQQVVGLERLL